MSDELPSLAVGGIAVAPFNTNIVVIGTGEATQNIDRVGGVGILRSTDGGATWKTEAITADSQHDNIRPYVVMNHEPDGPTVLWQNLSGHYRHYTNYRCSIKADRPAKVTVVEVPANTEAVEPKADQ